MLVSIGSYNICDGTLSGGVAVSDLRIRANRLFDFVVPIGDDASTFFDRINTLADYLFTVKKTHSGVQAAERFILKLDTVLPSSGTVTFTTTGPSGFTRTIPNGFIVDHALLQEQGATTFHQYHIVGGPPVA